MAAFSGFFAIGGAVVDGVLTELPGVARRAVAGDATGGTIALAQSVTFGPFTADAGPLAAVAIFAGSSAGAPLYTATLPPVTVRASRFLTFPAGVFVMTPGAPPGADVLTINGAPILLNGQPLQIS